MGFRDSEILQMHVVSCCKTRGLFWKGLLWQLRTVEWLVVIRPIAIRDSDTWIGVMTLKRKKEKNKAQATPSENLKPKRHPTNLNETKALSQIASEPELIYWFGWTWKLCSRSLVWVETKPGLRFYCAIPLTVRKKCTETKNLPLWGHTDFPLTAVFG